MVYTVHYAKTHLSKLIAAAEAGEEIVIARGDKPVVKLSLVGPAMTGSNPKKKREGGWLKGKVSIGPEFFEPLPEEELRLWEGGDD